MLPAMTINGTNYILIEMHDSPWNESMYRELENIRIRKEMSYEYTRNNFTGATTMAEVLSQTQQLLLEAPEPPLDEESLIHRAIQRACESCPAPILWPAMVVTEVLTIAWEMPVKPIRAAITL